jgi:processive 1,2-diacylglycerol beta-glucosyltransferase
MKRIFIFVTSTGLGHRVAGYALRDYIEEFLGISPLIFDPLKKALFPYSKSDSIYYFSSERLPFLWKFAYYFSDNKSYDFFLPLQNLFVKHGIVDIFYKEGIPDVILCTHPFYIPVLKEFKNSHRFRLISVTTDFGKLHRAWITEGYDLLWLSSGFTLKEVKKRYGFSDKFKVLGYPLRKGFWGIKKGKGKYILVMGGGKGVNTIKKVFDVVSSIDFPQVYICGRNEKLKKELEFIKEKGGLNHVVVYGFREDIPKLLSESIVLISKPGGSTVAEANFMEVPLLAVFPLPGQEDGNVEFIMNSDSGIVIKDLNELRIEVENIIKGKRKFEFREKLRSYFNLQKEFFQKICTSD